MLRNVLMKSLRDVRRSFAWWSLGIAGYVALIVAVWPTIKSNPALAKLEESYPEALKAFVSFGGEFDFGTPAGYLGAELFSLMTPLMLLVAAIGAGSRAIAGEEESGTLDLLLSHPVSRTRLALEKLTAVALEVVGLGIVFLIALWIGARAVSMHLAAAKLAAATAHAVLLALAFGAIAFMLGAAFGRRALATGVASAAAAAAYLVNGLAPLVSALQTPQKASPFYHYAAGDPLRHGLQPTHALLLLALGVAASVFALVGFNRRDLA